jgi:hypothetical protein
VGVRVSPGVGNFVRFYTNIPGASWDQTFTLFNGVYFFDQTFTHPKKLLVVIALPKFRRTQAKPKCSPPSCSFLQQGGWDLISRCVAPPPPTFWAGPRALKNKNRQRGAPENLQIPLFPNESAVALAAALPVYAACVLPQGDQEQSVETGGLYLPGTLRWADPHNQETIEI